MDDICVSQLFMDSKSLISSEFPVLSLEDSGEKALRLMNEYRVFHLPLIQRDNYPVSYTHLTLPTNREV